SQSRWERPRVRVRGRGEYLVYAYPKEDGSVQPDICRRTRWIGCALPPSSFRTSHFYLLPSTFYLLPFTFYLLNVTWRATTTSPFRVPLASTLAPGASDAHAPPVHCVELSVTTSVPPTFITITGHVPLMPPTVPAALAVAGRGLGDGDGLGPGDGDGLGPGDGLGDGDGLGPGDGLGAGAGVGPGDGLASAAFIVTTAAKT